jgi:hypothetical protein
MKTFNLKCLVIIIKLILIVNYFTKAQTNLIPNPSFEDTILCPYQLDQVNYANGWFSAYNSPDYFNSCAPVVSTVSIPSNCFGHQNASFGNAYSGFWAKNINNYREYLGTQLISSLQVGIKYYISFKVSLSSNPVFSEYCGVNKLGIHLSTMNKASIYATPLNNYSQVYSDNIITDTLDWITIRGSFISDSSYTYIIFGNFFTDSLTDSIQVLGNQCEAYYFLDDVCLSSDSALAYNYPPLGLLEEQNLNKIYISPNPCIDYININTQLINYSYSVQIFNSYGEEVYVKKNFYNPIEHIPIVNMDSGILYLKLIMKNKVFNYKLIKIEK